MSDRKSVEKAVIEEVQRRIDKNQDSGKSELDNETHDTHRQKE